MNVADDNQEQVEFLLSQYVDGDLDEATRQEVERCLADDPQLAALFEQLRHTDHLVKAWAGPAPEVDWDRFATEATRRREQLERMLRRQRLFRLFAPLSAAAAVALLVTLLHVVGRPDSASESLGPPVALNTQEDVVPLDESDPGAAFAQVTVVRTPGLEITETTRQAAAIAVVGAEPIRTQMTYEEQTPYF